jgi:hypothetical protein
MQRTYNERSHGAFEDGWRRLVTDPVSTRSRTSYAGAPREQAPSAPIYSDDVGASLAQAAFLRDQEPLDEATRALWAEAVSRALTGQASATPR